MLWQFSLCTYYQSSWFITQNWILPGPLSKRKRRLDSLEAAEGAPREPRPRGPPTSTGSLASQRHPGKFPKVPGRRRGKRGFPAAPRQRPRESFFNASRGPSPLPWLESQDALPLATRTKEIPGLISFRMDWLDLLAVQGTLKRLLQNHSSKASIPQHSAFFIVQLSHPYMTTGKTIALTRQNFVGKVMSLPFNMLSRLVIALSTSPNYLLNKYLLTASFFHQPTVLWRVCSFPLATILIFP